MSLCAIRTFYNATVTKSCCGKLVSFPDHCICVGSGNRTMGKIVDILPIDNFILDGVIKRVVKTMGEQEQAGPLLSSMLGYTA